MKKTIFIAVALILSTAAGFYLMTELKTQPVKIQGKDFSVTVSIPKSFKHEMSGSEIIVTKSYDVAIAISKEKGNEDVKIYQLGGSVAFNFRQTITKNLDELIQKEKDSKVLSQETFANGFGARFENAQGRKFFRYVVKSGDSSFHCRNNYFNMESEAEMINICKTIK